MSAERNRPSLSPASMRQAPTSSRNPCFPVPTSSPQTRGRTAIQDTGPYIHHPCREHYAPPKCTASAVVVFKSCQHTRSSGLALAAPEQVAIHTYIIKQSDKTRKASTQPRQASAGHDTIRNMFCAKVKLEFCWESTCIVSWVYLL